MWMDSVSFRGCSACWLQIRPQDIADSRHHHQVARYSRVDIGHRLHHVRHRKIDLRLRSLRLFPDCFRAWSVQHRHHRRRRRRLFSRITEVHDTRPDLDNKVHRQTQNSYEVQVRGLAYKSRRLKTKKLNNNNTHCTTKQYSTRQEMK